MQLLRLNFVLTGHYSNHRLCIVMLFIDFRHHMWSGPLSNMRPEILEAAKECQKMHEERGWEYIFWDDEKLQSLTGIPHLPELLANYPKRVRLYSDVIRLYILHRFGGVYLDIDSFCLRPFDPLLNYLEEERKDFLVNYESERTLGRQIANGIMIAAPASPAVSAYARHVGNKFATHKDWQNSAIDWLFTGPGAMSEVREQWQSWVLPHQIILSSTAFIPLYKDEGADLELNDVFEIALRQGSYTIQMYQTTKHTSMYNMIKKAIKRTDASKTLTSLDSDKKRSEAGESKMDNVDTDHQPSILMVVAHPDDEILWGGDYLIKERQNVHVVVTSTQNRETSERFKEFKAVQEKVGYHGEFLDGNDTGDSSEGLESHIHQRIKSLICENTWERIITHGPEGEYGHRRHQQVHDAVFAAVMQCNDISYGKKLFVFEPHPSSLEKGKDNIFSEDKVDILKLYKSQKNVIFDLFGNWKERIVPLQDYDFERASESCETSAAATMGAARRYQKCRLDNMLNFSSSSSIENYRQWEQKMIAAKK